jgi:hypothetical protein
MPFGLYEAGSEDATFVCVTTAQSNDEIEDSLRSRRRHRMERGRGPIRETRVVPHESEQALPMHAPLDELLSLIREYKHLYDAP